MVVSVWRCGRRAASPVLSVRHVLSDFDNFSLSRDLIPGRNLRVEIISPQFLLDASPSSIPELQHLVSLRDITYHVEQFTQLMSVLRYAPLILVTTSQSTSNLHTVINRKTIVKQLIIELSEGPFLLIAGHLLGIKIISLPGQVVGQQEYLPPASYFPIPKVRLTFSNKSVIGSGVNTAVVFLGWNGFDNSQHM